jgi:hypothetical protein
MKRDMDLVRGILLAHEEKSADNSLVTFNFQDFAEVDKEVLRAHVLLLVGRGYLVEGGGGGYESYVLAGSITSTGYDFLDSVRDPKIWKKTKEAAEAVQGWSISLLSRIADGYIKQLIKSKSGLEIV